MDSVTQILLGATVGAAVGGRRYGKKALLWGGVLGCTPDLDIFIPMPDPVSSFTEHRGFSHSLFTLSLVSPLIAILIVRLHKLGRGHWRHWCLLVWLSLVTHPLLDSFTIYGTQLFWPVPMAPMGLGSIFIIDPFYTLPLLASFLAFLLVKNRHRALLINGIALTISTCYLLTSLWFQILVENRVASQLENHGLEADKYLATPTPFNILLWRILVIEKAQYHEGYYSLLSNHNNIEFRSYPRRPELLLPIEDSPAVRRLTWFTKDYQVASEDKNRISLADIRMGFSPKFVFSFVVGKRNGKTIVPIGPLRNPSARPAIEDFKALYELL